MSNGFGGGECVFQFGCSYCRSWRCGLVAEAFCGIWKGFDSGFGDFETSGPDNGVEDEGAEVVIVPGGMVVSTGDAEAAAFVVGALVGPGNMLLFFAFKNGFADVGVS